MSMEIKLTDIRGEPPLKVGEFILDKDNNVLYVGSGDFGLTRNGGAEIGVMGRFIPIPPNKGNIIIKDNTKIIVATTGKFMPIPPKKASVSAIDNTKVNISVGCKFTLLNKHYGSVNVEDNTNINLKGSVNIVT